MQRTEQSAGSQPVAAGVPGTASNAPNSQALPVYPQQSTPPQTAKSESGTYGASKTVRHTVESPGRVRRLTAAIVVNDRLMQAAVKGKAAVWQNRSPEELRNLTALAQAAVGFDSSRGDMLTVEDLAFDDKPGRSARVSCRPDAGGAGELARSGQVHRASGGDSAWSWHSEYVLHCGEWGQFRSLPRARQSNCRERSTAKPALSPPEPPIPDPERTRAQEIFEQVSGHLKREPAQSSRLLQSWIHSD